LSPDCEHGLPGGGRFDYPHAKPVLRSPMDQSLPRPEYSGEQPRTELQKRADGGESQRTILEELYRRFQGRLYGFVRKSVRNTADAEDVVQQVLLKMNASFDSMIAREPVEAWIFTVAGHEVVNYYRQTGKTPLPAELETLEQDLSGQYWSYGSLPRDVEDEAENWVGRFGLVAAHLRVLVARSSISTAQLEDYWREVVEGMTQRELAQGRGVGQPRISQLKSGFEKETRIALYLCVILGLVRPPYREAEIREHLDRFDMAFSLAAAHRILLRRAGSAVRRDSDGQPALTPGDAREAIQDSSVGRVVTLAELHDSESVYAAAIPNPAPHCIEAPCAVHTASPGVMEGGRR